MKAFLIKALMMAMAFVAVVEGAILFLVAGGKISPDAVASFYYFLTETPKARNVLVFLGGTLLLFGAGLAIAASRIRSHEKPLILEKNGQTITILRSTVEDFVSQVLAQDRAIEDFTAKIVQEGKHALEIIISPVFKEVDSVPHELERIEKALNEKIRHVFELADFKITFQVKGVRAATEKKEAAPEEKPEIAPVDHEEASDVNDADDESVPEEKGEEDDAKEEKSIFKRMFSRNLYDDRIRRKRP